MKELKYFKASGIPAITDAIAGICKTEWTFIEKGAQIDEVSRVMFKNRFDILPVKEPDGSYIYFYKTNKWGDYQTNNLELMRISEFTPMYYLTNIQDVVAMFAQKKTNFFFLDNFTEVIGLITISNLNCQYVYTYIYNQIVQLEHALASYIYQSRISEDEVIIIFSKRLESENSLEAIKRFEMDKSKGTDRPFFEYLYLVDLFYILREFGLVGKIDISDIKYKKAIKKITKIRNTVAHPTKSLIQNEKSISELYEGLISIDELMDKLTMDNIV
jgi:hypothetical protein